MVRPAWIFLPIALAACQSAEPDLSAVIAFESRPECRFRPDTLRLFHEMIQHDPGTQKFLAAKVVVVPGLATPLRPRVTDPDPDNMIHATLPLQGRWHGLEVVELGHSFVPNSDVASYSLRFAEPPEAARAVLNRLGFDLPAGGEAREFGDGLTEYIWIEAAGSGSALRCAT